MHRGKNVTNSARGGGGSFGEELARRGKSVSGRGTANAKDWRPEVVPCA